MLFADAFPTLYCPSSDYRGVRKEKKHKQDFPRHYTNFTEETVLSVKNTIDKAIGDVISALCEEEKLWVESWIKEPMIMNW